MSAKPAAILAPNPTYQYRKPVRGSLVWWLRFFGVVAFITILAIQLPRSQEVQLSRIDVGWLGVCMLATLVQLALEALAWHVLLVQQRIPLPYPKSLLSYLASQYLGMVTPGHVGEFLAAGYISMNTGITFGYALSSIVVKKTLFWLVILGFGFWSLPLLAGVPFLHGVQEAVWATVVVVCALAVGITIWVISLRALARRWKTLSPWQVDMTEFWAGINQLATPRLLVPLAVAVIAFSMLFVQFYAILRAMGMGLLLPVALIAQIMAMSRIAARLIPISVVGLGSKDAAIIVLLAQQGIEYSVGITAVVLFLICSYLVTLLLSGLCWWIHPLVIRQSDSAARAARR